MNEFNALLAKTCADVSSSSASKDTLPSLPSSAIRAAIERYGHREQFLQTFHVDRQGWHAEAPVRCITGKAPSLEVVNAAYGEGTAEEWLVYAIAEFGEFIGARDKLTPQQTERLAKTIVQEYGWMKVTDLELFFHRMKLGRYGFFYGSFDPQRFMSYFTPFMRDRNDILAEIAEREERYRREHQFDGCQTWEEYHRDHPEDTLAISPFEQIAKEFEEKEAEGKSQKIST